MYNKNNMLFYKAAIIFLFWLVFINFANASDNTEIIGAWGESDASELFSLVFYSNGYYVHAEEIGIEYGTYNWNSSTGHLVSSVIIDNNGDHGLNSPNSSENYGFVNGDTITFIDGDETDIFNRVTHKDSVSDTKIFGAWGESDASGPFALVFYSNGYYVHVNKIGIEYGTYNWNSSTGHLISSVIIDNNGGGGLSDWDPNTPGNYSENDTFFVNEDTLTVIDGDETSIFKRVIHKTSTIITDTDDDGVPDQWDKCQDTPKGLWTDKSGCPASGIYTIEQMNQAVLKERMKYDPDLDGVIDLKVAIHALQIITDTIVETSDPVIPEKFSMDWLRGRTLYQAWYGSFEDSNGNYLSKVPVVVKVFFGNDDIATATGLMNFNTDSGNYNVDADSGLLYFGGDSSEGNKIVCGSTSQYIKTHYLKNGVYNNTDLYFFNEIDAMNSAALWGGQIPKCNTE